MMLSSAEVARREGVTPAAISNRIARGTLVPAGYIQTPTGPRPYFAEDYAARDTASTALPVRPCRSGVCDPDGCDEKCVEDDAPDTTSTDAEIIAALRRIFATDSEVPGGDLVDALGEAFATTPTSGAWLLEQIAERCEADAASEDRCPNADYCTAYTNPTDCTAGDSDRACYEE